MWEFVVNSICILTESVVEIPKWPRCFELWVYRLRYLSNIARYLGIPLKVVNELRVRCAEETFTYGTESRFCRRSSLLHALVTSKEGIEIDGSELFATIHYYDLRESAMQLHALSENHHARAITRRIEREMNGQDASAVCIGKEREPWTSQVLPSSQTSALDVQLRMIDVANLKGSVTMPRRFLIQFPIECFLPVGGTSPLSLERLEVTSPALDGPSERLIAGDYYPFLLTSIL